MKNGHSKRNSTPYEEGQARKEPPAIRWIRDSAGTVSVLGLLFLALFSLRNLLPAWIWTVEDEEKSSVGKRQ